jgi:COP9 signalosome complex subunit 2
MYASMNQWNEAYTNFYEAFRSYQDIGHKNVRVCLKYVVMASMLSETERNPFASQEAAVFKTNSDIIPVATLLRAFEDDDIVLFEGTLSRYRGGLFQDDFIRETMPAVQLRLRSRVLVKLIKPYKRVRLAWLCKQLNATVDEIENLVVNLILDGSINGRLDQIHSLLDLNYSTPTDKLYGAMDAWMRSVSRLQSTITSRTSRSDFGGGGRLAFGGYGMDFDMEDDFMSMRFGMDPEFVAWM